MVRPTIVTGLEALGRSTDLQRLNTFVQQIAPFGDAGLSTLNIGEYIKRIGTSLGVDMAGLIKSDEQLAAEQQAAQQEALQAQVAPQIAKEGAGMIRDSVKGEQEIEKERVKVNLLEKQLSNQQQQKIIINNLHQLESSFRSLKTNINSLLNTLGDNSSENISQQINDFESQLVSISNELEDTENKINENERELKSSITLLEQNSELVGQLSLDKNESDIVKNNLANQKNTLKQKIESLTLKVQSQELKVESLKSSQEAMNTAINRLEVQRTQLKSRSLELTLKAKNDETPEDDSKRKLESLLNSSLNKEKDLDASRKILEDSQTILRNSEIDRTNINSHVNQAREDLEHFKLNQKEYEVRKESLNDQLSNYGQNFETIRKKLNDNSIDHNAVSYTHLRAHETLR